MMEIAPFVIMLAIIFVIMFVIVFEHYQKSFSSFPPCSRLFAGSPLCASVTMLRATFFNYWWRWIQRECQHHDGKENKETFSFKTENEIPDGKTGLRAEIRKYPKTALRSILVQMEFKMDSRQYSEKIPHKTLKMKGFCSKCQLSIIQCSIQQSMVLFGQTPFCQQSIRWLVNRKPVNSVVCHSGGHSFVIDN